jgi:hypothetical protein
LVQETGLSAGSSTAFKIKFNMGDANMDNMLNIMDVQHSLNFILRRHVSAFNFAAADTYKDNMITVQDLVRTIDLIINTRSAVDNSPPFRSGVVTNNTLAIENGRLVIDTEDEIASLDIQFHGFQEKDFTSLLDDSKFQFIFNDSGNRLVLLSFTGDAIAPGRTALADIHSENARLIAAEACDPDAQAVPIRIAPSGITINPPVDVKEVRAFVSNGIVYCDLPYHADRVVATLYTLLGTVAEKQQTDDLRAGRHVLMFETVNHTGIYILNLVVESQGQIISKNIQLLLNK